MKSRLAKPTIGAEKSNSSCRTVIVSFVNQSGSFASTYTILQKVLGHPLLMKGLTTLVISMSTNLNV